MRRMLLEVSTSKTSLECPRRFSSRAARSWALPVGESQRQWRGSGSCYTPSTLVNIQITCLNLFKTKTIAVGWFCSSPKKAPKVLSQFGDIFFFENGMSCWANAGCFRRWGLRGRRTPVLVFEFSPFTFFSVTVFGLAIMKDANN